MHKEIKKYFSIVLLFIFLFPMVEKGVHDIQHSIDKHCSASEKHFHDPEHHCTICDFTISDSNASATTEFPLINSAHPFLFHFFIESVHTGNAFQLLPSRAPPQV